MLQLTYQSDFIEKRWIYVQQLNEDINLKMATFRCNPLRNKFVQ